MFLASDRFTFSRIVSVEKRSVSAEGTTHLLVKIISVMIQLIYIY